MTEKNNFPWTTNLKPTPTPEQAEKLADLNRVAMATRKALESFAESTDGKYESPAWRETYAKLETINREAVVNWSSEADKYTV